jgi:FkbM family methyltransferase
MERAARIWMSEDHQFFQVNPIEARYLYKEIFVRQMYGAGRALDFPERALVVDVGANIGLFTRYVLGRQPSVQVLSLEPAPACYEALELNTKDFPGVTPLQYAASDCAGMVEFTFYPGYTMLSSVYPDTEAASALIRRYTENVSAAMPFEQREKLLELLPALTDRRLTSQAINVQQVRLDSVLEQHYAGQAIDLIKVDVEGAEVATLTGLGEWGRHMRRAVVEVRGAEPLRSITELLADWGMESVVEQDPDYTGTDLYMVYARRSGAGG